MRIIRCIFAVVLPALAVAESNRSLLSTRTRMRSSVGYIGASLAVSQKGLSGWIGELESTLISTLSNLKIPDDHIHFSHGSVELNSIHTTAFSGSFAAAMTAGPGLQVQCSDAEVALSLRFKYSVWGIGGAGKCKFKASKSKVAVSGSLQAVKGALIIGGTEASIKLGSLWHQCDGISGNILNVILDELNGKITKEIQTAGAAAIEDAIKKQVAPALASLNLDFPITDGFALVRFDAESVEHDAHDSVLSVGVAGDIVQTADKADPPGLRPVALPVWDAQFADSDLQVAVSAWTLQTGCVNYQRAGHLAYDVQHTVIPSASPVQLNTSDLAVFAPGLRTAYPEGRWMQIALAIEEGTNVTTTAKDGLRVTGPVGARFQVLEDAKTLRDAFSISLATSIGVDVDIEDRPGQQLVKGNITTLSLVATLKNSTVGEVHLLPELVNFVTMLVKDIGLPIVNQYLQKHGLPLPSVPNLVLTKSKVGMRSDYFVVASDIDFPSVVI